MRRKKFLRLGLALTLITALALLFNGCPDDGGGTTTASKFTVTFNLNAPSGAQGVSQTPAKLTDIAKGAKISAPAIPTSDTHTFVGWYKEAAGTNEWKFATDTVSANITLHGKWTVTGGTTYTVQFNLNTTGIVNVTPASYPNQTNLGGTVLVTVPSPAPESESHNFVGWFKGTGPSALEANPYVFTTPVTSNFTLYAKWDLKAGTQTWEVTFELNAATYTNPAITGLSDAPTKLTGIVNNTTINEPAEAPKSTNYNFAGWYKEAAGTNEWVFETDKVEKNTTLYAKWDAGQIKVEFHIAHQGILQPTAEGLEDITHLAIGAKVARPTVTPTSTSHDFTNWYKESDWENLWNFDTDTVSGEGEHTITIYAGWQIKTFQVQFDLNLTKKPDVVGAIGAPATITVDYNQPINVVLATPTSTTHDFSGWYKDNDCTEEWSFTGDPPDLVTENITLYADWSPKTPFNISQITYTWEHETNRINFVVEGHTIYTKYPIKYGDVVVINGPGANEGCTGHIWIVENSFVTNAGATYTFDSKGRGDGEYPITLVVTKDGVVYSGEITIVIEGDE